MPAFIKTPKDEKRWSEAKRAASKTLSESDGDKYWALTNSIYQKMNKTDEMLDTLTKVRDNLSKAYGDDEDPEYGAPKDEDIEGAGMRIIDDPFSEDDAADKWLTEHDPQKIKADEPAQSEMQAQPTTQQVQEVKPASKSGYSDWKPRPDYSQDDTAKMKDFMDQGYSHREAERMAGTHSGPSDFQGALKHTIRPSEMSPKMLAELKTLAGPWLDNAEKYDRLNADIAKNPMKHAEGQMMRAHEEHAGGYADAYHKFLDSDAVKNAKGRERFDAIKQWKDKYHKENPKYMENMPQAQLAQSQLKTSKDQAKLSLDEKLKHIMSGGVSMPTEMTSAEAAQHVGGVQTEEGVQASFKKDPLTAFAQSNPKLVEAIKQRANPQQLDRYHRVVSARAAKIPKPEGEK
jgi:hypothetical protein